MDGLLAFVDRVLRDEPPQRADDRRLVGEVHRQVRIVPGAHHAQALEVVALDSHVLLRVRAAGAAEVHHAHLPLLRAQLAIHLELNREAVAVPARDVRRVEAGHRARADHEVLDRLVQGRAEMDAPVGVRRAVMQDEARRAGAGGADAFVQAHRFPAGDDLRLGGLQVRLHREGRARKVQRVFPVGHKSVVRSGDRRRGELFILPSDSVVPPLSRAECASGGSARSRHRRHRRARAMAHARGRGAGRGSDAACIMER